MESGGNLFVKIRYNIGMNFIFMEKYENKWTER